MARKHRVNWHLDLGKSQHREGEEIYLEPELSAHLTKLGVVTPLEAEQQPVEVAAIAPEVLTKMSKGKLADYAQEKFGKALNAADMTKDAMLAEIAALAAQGN
jgi:hypothetical protein